MTSDDYKKGWYDGYHAKNDVKFYPPNTTPTLNPGVNKILGKVEGGVNREIKDIPISEWGKLPQKKCSVCGMEFTNPDGSIKALGYVCGNNKCPSKNVFY